MADRPSGTVTFLFTDIEGSTRLWDEHADVMRVALARHDEILRAAIGTHDGVVFSTGGDGVAAAFHRAADGVGAAVDAQRMLANEPWPDPVQLRVRMGVHTGEAQERDGDYFGPPVNRAARVMAVGHGGQVLVSASTASLVPDVTFIDLGEHRLRDLSGVERLFQVGGDGLVRDFPPLRTVDAVPGNLPVQVTSFVGRDAEVKELAELVRAHRLVTLTGVGGVGKTRLSVQVAAELVPEFPDGVWLIELAPIGDPAALPDAVATVLSVTPRPGRTMNENIAEELAGRRLLIVLDNCEHLLDAAADLVETVVGRASTVNFVATSREGLRVRAEHLWPVPSLDVRDGAASAAVELFVERARAVLPDFDLSDAADADAVMEICRRLDGIALAIELAAARMVSMSPVEVLERLTDRFRLLSGSRRGLERHQTLRQAVQWSYDLLGDDERVVLLHCAVFAGGFDLSAAAHLCEGFDEYAVLDVLDSLVRKSLVTAERVQGHTRYGLLETIRQFAEDQLAATVDIDVVRDRHADLFARRAVANWLLWDRPGSRVALDWADAEFANLRTGFRWAADRGDLDTAAAIAAHTAVLAWNLQRYEPVGWIEEILGPAATAEVRQLPRLYVAAGLSAFTDRAEDAIDYVTAGLALESDPRFDPFEPGLGLTLLGTAHLFSGRPDRFVELGAELSALAGVWGVAGMCAQVFGLPALGRSAEAALLADATCSAAVATGQPFALCYALVASGRALADADPARALDAFRQGISVARENRILLWEGVAQREAAGFEALHGSIDDGLASFADAVDSFHRSGDHGNLATTLANLAVFFDRIERPEIAATVYGTTAHSGSISMVLGLPEVLDHLRAVLGDDAFDAAVAAGAAMTHTDAVQYARREIGRAMREVGMSS